MLRRINRDDIYKIYKDFHTVYEDTSFKDGLYNISLFTQRGLSSDKSVVRRVAIVFPKEHNVNNIEFICTNVTMSSEVNGFYWTTVPLRVHIRGVFSSLENWYIRKTDQFYKSESQYLNDINYGCIYASFDEDTNTLNIEADRDARIDKGLQDNIFSRITSFEVTYKKKLDKFKAYFLPSFRFKGGELVKYA